MKCEMMADAMDDMEDEMQCEMQSSPQMAMMSQSSLAYGACAMSAQPAPVAPKSNLKYEDLVSKQSSDGSWSIDLLDFVLKYVSEFQRSGIKQAVNNAPSDNQKAILTSVVLAILMIQFGEQRDEWKLIEKKAKNFIKKNPCKEADFKLYED